MFFDFATAGRILFGTGVSHELLKIAPEMGQKALVVTGAGSSDTSALFELLNEAGVQSCQFVVAGEPDVHLVQKGVEVARAANCDFVIGFGGGSALDAGKAIAAMMTNPGELLDYLEVVGRGLPYRYASAPYVAMPTTAGTGTEVTRNAVIAVPEAQVKVSMRSNHLLPRIAVVDPEWTLSLPAALTASTGMDALTQVLEPFVSTRANAISDLTCRAGLAHVGIWLLKAYTDGTDREARTGMSFASLMGGLSLANAGLGAVHGFAGPIGGMFDAPHGAVCACLLPIVTRANVKALQERAPESGALSRYEEAARILTGHAGAEAEDGIRWIEKICTDMRIDKLGSYGVARADIPVLVKKAQKASSMKTNPVELQPDELADILEQAL